MINFNRVIIGPSIKKDINKSLKGHISGSGPFSKKCENLIEKQLGVKKALLVTSCTHALEAAAILINIKPGDEVIVPSYTFVSTALAFQMRGAKIIFADVRKDTFNIDENIIEKVLKNLNVNPKTFLLRSTSSSIKDSLKKRTSEAYEKGVFGAPSFISNNKVFWGQDRIEFALNEAKK